MKQSDKIAAYVTRQLHTNFPDDDDCAQVINGCIQSAWEATEFCISRIKPWSASGFDPYNSGQYATFLYFLSRQAYLSQQDERVATKLFLLNKLLNSIELFYEIELPSHFFLSHTIGSVFAKADYGNFLVVHQNCTVGRKGDLRPTIEERVVLYPGSMVIGNCHLRQGTVLAPGVCLVDIETPEDCYVLSGGKKPRIRPAKRNVSADYFNMAGESNG